MDLMQHIQTVRTRIETAALAAGRAPEEITLCAATKVQTDDTIRAAIAAGIRVCGENRVQELTAHLAADAYAGARVHFQASHLIFTCDKPIPWTIDGEYGGNLPVNEVMNCQKALTIIRGK